MLFRSALLDGGALQLALVVVPVSMSVVVSSVAVPRVVVIMIMRSSRLIARRKRSARDLENAGKARSAHLNLVALVVVHVHVVTIPVVTVAPVISVVVTFLCKKGSARAAKDSGQEELTSTSATTC